MTEFPQFLNEKVKMNGNEIILRVNPGRHAGADDSNGSQGNCQSWKL